MVHEASLRIARQTAFLAGLLGETLERRGQGNLDVLCSRVNDLARNAYGQVAGDAGLEERLELLETVAEAVRGGAATRSSRDLLRHLSAWSAEPASTLVQ